MPNTQNPAGTVSQDLSVPSNVRIKKRNRNNDGAFVDPLPQNIPANMQDRYEEIDARSNLSLKVNIRPLRLYAKYSVRWLPFRN